MAIWENFECSQHKERRNVWGGVIFTCVWSLHILCIYIVPHKYTELLDTNSSMGKILASFLCLSFFSPILWVHWCIFSCGNCLFPPHSVSLSVFQVFTCFTTRWDSTVWLNPNFIVHLPVNTGFFPFLKFQNQYFDKYSCKLLLLIRKNPRSSIYRSKHTLFFKLWLQFPHWPSESYADSLCLFLLTLAKVKADSVSVGWENITILS